MLPSRSCPRHCWHASLHARWFDCKGQGVRTCFILQNRMLSVHSLSMWGEKQSDFKINQWQNTVVLFFRWRGCSGSYSCARMRIRRERNSSTAGWQIASKYTPRRQNWWILGALHAKDSRFSEPPRLMEAFCIPHRKAWLEVYLERCGRLVLKTERHCIGQQYCLIRHHVKSSPPVKLTCTLFRRCWLTWQSAANAFNKSLSHNHKWCMISDLSFTCTYAIQGCSKHFPSDHLVVVTDFIKELFELNPRILKQVVPWWWLLDSQCVPSWKYISGVYKNFNFKIMSSQSSFATLIFPRFHCSEILFRHIQRQRLEPFAALSFIRRVPERPPAALTSVTASKALSAIRLIRSGPPQSDGGSGGKKKVFGVVYLHRRVVISTDWSMTDASNDKHRVPPCEIQFTVTLKKIWINKEIRGGMTFDLYERI